MSAMTNRFAPHTGYESFANGKHLYFQLRRQLDQAGCFSQSALPYVFHIALVLTLYFGGFYILLLNPGPGIRMTTLILIAFANVQAGVIAHEAGHGAITNRRWKIVLLGQTFNTFLTALCYSHFQYIHKRHHSHTNEIAKDLDVQSNTFSLYPESAREKRTKAGRFITKYQELLIWPLVTLQGFSLKIDSMITLRKNPEETRIDQLVLILHGLLWFGLPVYMLGLTKATANYLLMTWFAGPYLGSIFLVNNLGMYYVRPDEKLPFLHQQLITTRNLGRSKFEDFVFGGLNHHIEHHLFPTIPMFKLRQARIITRNFCSGHNLPYTEMSWFKAIGEVHAHLRQVKQQL